MNMFVQLYIALRAIKKRDNAIIDNLLEEFTDYDESHYNRPLYTSKHLAQALINNTDFDVVDVFKNETEVNDNGFKAEKDSYEFWFRFKDVKIRRRKIYRLGDYYLRIVNNGYGKWTNKFYIKAPVVEGNTLVNTYIAASHPHISMGMPCTSEWQDGLTASYKAYNFEGLLSKYKLYLDKWTYQSPHHMPEDMAPRMRVANSDILPNMFIIDQDEQVEYRWLSSSTLNDLGYEDQMQWKRYNYVSARRKLHEPEPLPRLMHAYSVGKVQPLNKPQISGGNFARTLTSKKSAVFSLFHNFDSFCKLPDYANLNENEKFVVCLTFVNTIYDKVAVRTPYKGSWNDERQNYLQNVRKQIDIQSMHCFNDAKDEYNRRYSYAPAVFEPDVKLRDAIQSLRLAIDEGLSLLDNLRISLRNGSSTNSQYFKDFWHTLTTELIRYKEEGTKFVDYHDMLDFCNKLEIENKQLSATEVFNETKDSIDDMFAKYRYLTNISYAKKHREYLQYIEAHIENYEHDNPQEKEEVNNDGNNTNNTEESTPESTTSAQEVS